MCFLLLLFLFDSGDILVFLTGQDEIESLAKLITDCAQHCGSGEFNLLLQGNNIVWRLRFTNITFQVKRSKNWKYICVCSKSYNLLARIVTFFAPLDKLLIR